MFAVAAGLFAIWGIALWLYNALFFKFSEFFSFEPLHVAWTMSSFHVAYFLLAIPAALFSRQFGYKLGYLFGLSVFALGAFLLYLAILQQSAGFFLAAVVTIGSAGAWLDTSLNPLAVEAGTPQKAVARLNLAHLFNGMGLYTGYLGAIWLVEKHYQLSVGDTAHLSARPYVLVGLGAIMLAFLVEQISLPSFAARPTEKETSVRGELRASLNDRIFLIAAAALCAYTVVLTILWTSNYNYRVLEVPGHTVGFFERGAFCFAIGRLAGTVLMRWVNPMRILQCSAGLCLVAVVLAVTVGGMFGWLCLLSASFFLSIVFPTVFASAISRHWASMKLASGLMATAAGIGSAASALLVPLALHALHVDPHIVIATAVPFLAVIFYYSVAAHRQAALSAQ